MFYDRVMRNIQNRHKRIMPMNSFINDRLQRKLRKFSENPFSSLTIRVPCLTCDLGTGSRVLDPTFRVPDLGSHLQGPRSRIPGPTYEMGPGSRVPLTGYVVKTGVFYEDKFMLSCATFEDPTGSNAEAAVRRCSSKQVLLKISQYSQESSCVGGKETPIQVFSCKIFKTFKITYLEEHLPTTTSES